MPTPTRIHPFVLVALALVAPVAAVAPVALGCKKRAPEVAPVDAAPPPFCQRFGGPDAGAPRVCEDFDAPDFDVSTRALRSDGDAKLETRGGGFGSAIVFSDAPVDGGGAELTGASMMTSAMLGRAVREAHVGFDLSVRALSATAGAPVQLARMAIGSYQVTLEADTAGARVVETYMAPGAPKKATPLALPLPRGAFARVAIDWSSNEYLAVAIDGKSAARTAPLALRLPAREVDLVVGVRQEGTPTVNEAAFDDLTLDAK